MNLWFEPVILSFKICHLSPELISNALRKDSGAITIKVVDWHVIAALVNNYPVEIYTGIGPPGPSQFKDIV